MNQRLFIVLVVILIVLYVIGTGVGISNQSGGDDDDSLRDQIEALQTPPAWMDAIGQRLTFDIGLDDITVEDDCELDQTASPPRLRATGDCTLAFSDIGFNPITRRLRLRLIAAPGEDGVALRLEQAARLPVDLTMLPPTPTPTPMATAGPGQPTSTPTPTPAPPADVRLSIFRTGGTLNIENSCDDDAPCIFLVNP